MEVSDFKRRASEFYKDEITDRAFYESLSKRVDDATFKEQLKELSRIEDEHASFWQDELKKLSYDTSKLKKKGLKIRLLFFVMRILGPALTIRMLEHGESRAIAMYREMIDESADKPEMKTRLEHILDQEINHEGIFQSQIEKTEEEIERSRDIIYGMSDGLVEVLGAVAGLTAILFNNYLIALGGFVVAISGAMSMSLGSYLASTTQNEFKIHQIERESLFKPSKSQKEKIENLGERSKKSAATTAAYYLIGAAIPIFPYLLFPRLLAVIVSISLVAITQALSNAIVALSMNVSILRSASRATLLTLITAGATYAVGELFHIVFKVSVF